MFVSDFVYVLRTRGEQKYRFSIELPELLPSTFHGVFGDITFYAKAIVDIPWTPDMEIERSIIIRNSISLSHMPELNVLSLHMYM